MSKTIDKLAWLEIQNNKLLCAKTQGKALYYVPGGKRESGESDVQALSREIKEELDVDLDISSLDLFGRFEAQADDKPNSVNVCISGYQGSYRGELKASSEIASIAWLSYQDKHQCSVATQQIFEALRKHGQLY